MKRMHLKETFPSLALYKFRHRVALRGQDDEETMPLFGVIPDQFHEEN